MGLITYHDFSATSAFRVYHTAEILQHIASSLPKKSILSLMLSSFHAFEVALREYWRSADIRSVEHLVERDCTPVSRIATQLGKSAETSSATHLTVLLRR